MPLSVCLTFDFDALSPWVFEMAEGNVAALSRGEFGAVAVPQILELVERPGSLRLPNVASQIQRESDATRAL